MTTPASAAPATRHIGIWTAVALVMGNMIGSGIFLLPASLALFGGIGLAAWVVSAAGSICLALVFARLSRLDPAHGGPYAFTRKAFGDLAGFLVAWGYWISVWCGNAAIAMAGVGSLEPFFPTLVHTPAAAALLATAAVWLLTGVNVIGIREAGHVQNVTTVLKILPLVVIGIGGTMVFKASHFPIAAVAGHSMAGSLAAAAALTFWAFGGLESATIPADAIHNPERTISRATIIGTALCAVIYIVSTIGVMSLIDPKTLATAPAPFADAAQVLFGGWARKAMAIGAAIACFGALNGWILIAGQVPMAIAKDGLFPRMFARVSRRGTPAHGLIISGLLTTGLLATTATDGLVKVFTFIILLGTLNALVPYAFSSLAGLIIERQGSGPSRASRGATVIAALAFAYALWAIGGSGADVVYWGFLLLLAGLPVYVWVARQRETERLHS
jgi:APA family basic amino acid/polyamine antiporter